MERRTTRRFEQAAGAWRFSCLAALLAAAVAAGCGGGDNAGNPPGGASGAGAQAGAAGTAGMGGSILDASPGGSGGVGGQGGSQQEGGADAPDAIGNDAGGSGGATEGGTKCTSDGECAGNPLGGYCDTVKGVCVQCKAGDPSTCQQGLYCDPATSECKAGCDTPEDCDTGMDAGNTACDPNTHKCVNCASDNDCPLGMICKSNACEAGCTNQHGCASGFTCCAGACTDTSGDNQNCGGCSTPCAPVHGIGMCVGGTCTLDSCLPGYDNCDQDPANGCEAPGSCTCTPGEMTACYDGFPDTQDVGACHGGQAKCNAQGTAWGPCTGQVLPVAETCLNLSDDDCDGMVNEEGAGCVCPPNETQNCYTGPVGTRNVGACVDGTWTCNAQGTDWSPCVGQVLPLPETCLTPVDDDCNGMVNEAGGAGCSCTANATQPCYSGPPGTEGTGVCVAGVQTCDALGQGWGPCVGSVSPSPDVCTDSLDNDCNGVLNDGFMNGVSGCECFPLSVATCYEGPAGTQDVGECKGGIETCAASGASWSGCNGQVVPTADSCADNLDNDCNGVVNDGFGKGGAGCVCLPGVQKDCYTGPNGTLNVGVCKSGKSTCSADGKAWGACIGQIIPDLDSCLDQVDNDCNGVLNDGNHLAPGCACVPGAIKCVNGLESKCSALGDWGTPAGWCNQICHTGDFSCSCNQVMQCDASVNPAKWVPKNPALICANTQTCDATTGTCKAVTTTGGSVATGTYYQYGVFTAAPFLGGYDVDSISDPTGEFIYVNRGGSYLDKYKVTIADSDGDGKIEPNQHPNNPAETGPIEQRTLTLVKTYTVAADLVPMGPASQAEIFINPTMDKFYSLGPTRNGDITEYIFATKAKTVVVHPTAAFALSEMGFGPGDSTWYGSNESYRRVYSFCSAAKTWILEFQYPDLAGSHMDGIEVIIAPSTQIQYVYVSDMTSDFLAQYRRNPAGGWIQENLFKYADVTGSSVEGMGFGALNHFWVTGGNTLIEIGGGDLTQYLQ
jgi:hypothetical protein